MSKNILFVNMSENAEVNPLSIDFSKYTVPFNSERYVYPIDETLEEIKKCAVHILHYPLLSWTGDEHLREMYTSVRDLNTDFIIFNVDSIMRIFLSPLFNSYKYDNRNESWIQLLACLSKEQREKSLFLINSAVLPLNAIYLLLKDIERFRSKHDAAPSNLQFSRRKRLKDWGVFLDHLIEYEHKNEAIPFKKSVLSLTSKSAIYIHYDKDTILDDDKKLYTFSNYYYRYNLQPYTTVFVDNYWTRDLKPDIDEMLLSFMDSELGTIISEQPRLLELLYQMKNRDFSILYVHTLNDLSEDIEVQQNIVNYADKYNVSVHVIDTGRTL